MKEIKLPVRSLKNFSAKRMDFYDVPFTRVSSRINNYYSFISRNKILRAKLLKWIDEENCEVEVYDSTFNEKSGSIIEIKPSDFDCIHDLGIFIFNFNDIYYCVYLPHKNCFIGKLKSNDYLPAYDLYDPTYKGNQATVWRVKDDADYYAKKYHGKVIEILLRYPL